jgi:hypothetical protein
MCRNPLKTGLPGDVALYESRCRIALRAAW